MHPDRARGGRAHAARVSGRAGGEALFSRIDEANPELNAIVAQRDRTQLIEEVVVAERWNVAGDDGPLERMPLGVRDLEDARSGAA